MCVCVCVGGGGGHFNPPSIFLALNFCFLTDYQLPKAFHLHTDNFTMDLTIL